MPPTDFSPEFAKGLDSLMNKLPIYYDASRSLEYLRRFRAQARMIPASPPPLRFLQHDYTRCLAASEPQAGITDVVDALMAARGMQHQPRIVTLKRNKTASKNTLRDVSLVSYLRFRRMQGVAEIDALAEWNGAQLA